MQKTKKITLLTSVACFAGIPFCWWYYLYSYDAFGDIYGMIMAIAMCLCLGVAFLIISLADRGSALFPKAIMLIGISVIIYGFWIFSEKSHFAEKPVVQTEAIVRSANTPSRGCTIEIFYKYPDAEGRWYSNNDYEDGCIPIYNQFADLLIHGGSRINVNYLQANPAVSRLLPGQHNAIVYFTKALVILLGFIILKNKWRTTDGRKFTAGPFRVTFRIKPRDPK